MNRRTLLFASLVPIGTASALFFSSRKSESIAKTSSKFEVTKTEAQWRKILTPEQFEVLRKEGTERAGTSPLTAEHRQGKFACAGCNLPLFVSETKFESGTGWPSFYAPIANAVKTSVDTSFGVTRTEVHCRRCGGHLGHVFEDGPKPTGLRYCMNGVAMKFIIDSNLI
ncbi:peptide-methionine (R)-S-oxide reductase MsrB [Chamaesiphon minutus]|uniref:peptide-methionine (R)-S-oxide reductase n=1 Tax=Chamaesiphon minutus (strain ATCC 27169 / PCC 6605) TaxID=1173020 RepID=K9UPL5_CHAP6|nr:peptide-methionine (R)-S-oxide reductase MsrB [Chamaesiphon minutus]AFY97032.1 methionine-R-sulfoxide reductase [Chamaesiphon minutus PCC 6605]